MTDSGRAAATARAPRDDEPRDPAAATTPAWEMIEAGRYRPRRTRGSFPGRELG